ncbi:hypothetical protein [Actinoplanes sp. NPDC049265]|uniref:hypothetical protein n=1 Tax=Actinoplanes sp. NPDC049265 TaxID=3363902 RepID=UPI003714A89F
MAISAYPFDGQDTTETQYSQLFRELQDTGVADSIGGPAFLVAATGNGLALSIQPGLAIVRGHAVASTAVETLTLSGAGSAARQDRIVLRLDPTANTITPAILTGPNIGLTQTDTGVYELSLALINVAANSTTLNSANVVDERRYVGSRVGSWTTAQRPVDPRRYRLGFNTSTGKWEFFNGTTWIDMVAPTADNATRWNGYALTVSPTTPSGAPTADRIWIQPMS